VPLDPDARLSLSADATLRGVGDEAVILNVKSGEIYTCNETAREFIRKLDGTRTLGDASGEMEREYDIDQATLLSDLSELIAYLLEEGVLVRAQP
jgi:hypothetical protein